MKQLAGYTTPDVSCSARLYGILATVDIKSLKQFQHLATSLNFSATAAAMYVSPPTLTRIIMRLEDEFGVKLFTRDNRNVHLTNAGQKFLAFTNETLARYHSLKSELDKQQSEVSGDLSVFCSVTAAQTYLPRILEKIRQRYPEVNIKLDTGDHAFALSKLSDRRQDSHADATIAIHTPDFPGNIHFQAIDTVPLVLIVPNSSNINSLEDVNWQQNNVIMPARGPSNRIVNQWFDEKKLQPQIYASVSGNEAIVSMVALSLGIGFVPRIVLEESNAKNKVRSIAVEDIEQYRLGLCYLKERANEPLILALSQMFNE